MSLFRGTGEWVFTVYGGRGRVVDRGGRERIPVRQRGTLAPWLEGGGHVLLSILPYIFLLRVGGDNLL